MESEKVKEIKKALEVYGNENKGITILRSGEIQSISYADILIYIKELEKCSEKWQKLCADEVALNKTFRDKINELESENERLKEENRILSDNDTLLEMVALLSKETDILLNRIAKLEKENGKQLKQFAERLKGKFEHCVGDIYHADTIDERIDETLNEFLKGENNE